MYIYIQKGKHSYKAVARLRETWSARDKTVIGAVRKIINRLNRQGETLSMKQINIVYE